MKICGPAQMWIGKIGPIEVSDVSFSEPLVDIPFGFRPSPFPSLDVFVQNVNPKAWAAAVVMAHSRQVTT